LCTGIILIKNFLNCQYFPVKCREIAGNEVIMTRFQKGISGNPKGKKVGTLNKKTMFEQYFHEHAEALINKTIELGLAGDPVALRLCIERLIPKKITQSATFVMPNLSAFEKIKIIPELLKSLSGQEISISDMKGLIDILQNHDNEIERNEKNHIKLELNTKDPNEAARVYAQIMQRS